MGSLQRKIKRQEEFKELINIRNTYGKKPKIVCPKCKKRSLFMSNNNGEIFCIRCDSKVGEKKK